MQPPIAANIQEQQASSRRDGQGNNRHWLKPSDKKSVPILILQHAQPLFVPSRRIRALARAADISAVET